MKRYGDTLIWTTLLTVLVGVYASGALAKRTVNWQINPNGFPEQTAVFVDVDDNGAYNRKLKAGAFAISIDEFGEGQGGVIANATLRKEKSTVAGWTGAQVLILIDVSQSYTSEFSKAKQAAKQLISAMDVKRDEVAVATFPSNLVSSESRLNIGFTNDAQKLYAAIDAISTVSDKNQAGRLCDSVSEGIEYFGEKNKDKYRTIIVITGGADKGEGQGNCVQDSYKAGVVPVWTVGYRLDKKYDTLTNSHKVENGLYELAQNTGGRSIYKKSVEAVETFMKKTFWYRIRSQYRLIVNFMCYEPAPQIEHTSVLKVNGIAQDPIKFRARTSKKPTPVITAFYPASATRELIDSGKGKLTIDGSGFCGAPGQIVIRVGDQQLATDTAAPYRVVGELNKAVETGIIKVSNKWTQKGESATEFLVAKPPQGADAMNAIVVLVLLLVVLVAVSIIAVALKSRKAVVPMGNASAKGGSAKKSKES
ncbi:MAG: VWA domain-containing protein [Deltaproteobacteria bacterium]|nr:VWA domain-containing protein [Deltaproteobacteria bacterium]MBN2673043.1 VWA domain-containing protein [Deltaproteobacteria bacterium]